MSRLIKTSNKNEDTLVKFLDSHKSDIDNKLVAKNNFYEAYKYQIAKELLKEDDVDELIKSNNTIGDAVNLLSKYQLELFDKYSNSVEDALDSILNEENIDISSDEKMNISMDTTDKAMSMIQMEVDQTSKLPDNSDMEEYIKEIIVGELTKQPNVNNTSTDNVSNNNPNNNPINNNSTTNSQPVKYTIEYSDSDEAKNAIDELKSIMNGISGFNIKNIRTPQTANKKVLAVTDLFNYLQTQGFDINLVKNGMCAAYYEGNDPSTPNGNVDNIFYYQIATAKVKTRLKRIAEDQLLLPAPEEQLQLPEGKPEIDTGYYVITNDLQLKKFDDFVSAESWLLNNRKDIISRELLNGFNPTNNDWADYEKKMYENYSSERYKNGPVEDVTYKAIEITLPNDSDVINEYNEWLNKYKQLFKIY